jgi:hypothetical protein
MCLPRWRRSLAAVYGEGGDCSLSNPDIAPSSCAMDCTEPSIRSTVVESAYLVAHAAHVVAHVGHFGAHAV